MGEPEFIYVESFASISELIQHIIRHCGSTCFHVIYETDGYGEFTKLSEISVGTGFHQVQEVTFKLKDVDYRIINQKGNYILDTEASKVLYGKVDDQV